MPTSPGTTGLVAWWSLDEASGNRADSHTGGYTLTDVNTCGSRAGVVAAGSDHAAASSEYLSTTEVTVRAALTGSASWSLVGWVLCDVKYGAFAGARVGGLAGLELLLQWFNVDNQVVAYWYDDGLNAVADASLATTLSTGVWYQVGAVYDAATETLFAVLNGARGGGATTAGKTFTARGGFRLGDSGFGTGLDGGMDEWACYSRALSTDELDWLYNGGAGRSYADLATASAKGLPIIAHHYRAVFGGGR